MGPKRKQPTPVERDDILKERQRELKVQGENKSGH